MRPWLDLTLSFQGRVVRGFNSERKRNLGGAREEREVKERGSLKVLGSDSREEALCKELKKSKVPS